MTRETTSKPARPSQHANPFDAGWPVPQQSRCDALTLLRVRGWMLAKNRRRMRTQTLCVMLPLLLASCNSAGSQPAAQIDARGSATPNSPSTDQLNAIFAERESMLHDIEQELVRRCMAKEGFGFATTSSTVITERRALGQLQVPPAFGSDDVVAAQQTGYAVPDTDEVSEVLPADKTNEKIYQALPSDQRLRYDAMLNPPLDNAIVVQVGDGYEIRVAPEGCVTEARIAIYEDLAAYLRLAHIARNLENEARALVEGDERYQRLLPDWSACMQDRGHAFQSWPAAYEAALAEPANERDIAVADTTCAQQVGTVRTAWELKKEHDQKILSTRQEELVAYGRMLDSAIATSSELVD